MSSLKSLPANLPLSPDGLDQWFPIERQRHYTAILQNRGGLTRRRAEYFVRLWAYLLLKQQESDGQLSQPLSDLQPPVGMVACTHREAAELFYGNQDRGSDRAAGMMIDRLVALGLIEKRFDGQTLCLQVRSLPELASNASPQPPVAPALIVDEFNPRTDAIPVANLITRTYAELMKDNAAASHKITRALRTWAQQYPKGMRVLRRQDTQHPVAISVLYPTASESEFNFFQPPSKSFYLSNDTPIDPFQMAVPGDPNCSSVYIRAWIIDMAYLNGETLCWFLEDTRQTLQGMQADFPNLCDIYSLVVHPLYEELRRVLGFNQICQDTQRSYAWIYLALDRFMELNIPKALSQLRMKG